MISKGSNNNRDQCLQLYTCDNSKRNMKNKSIVKKKRNKLFVWLFIFNESQI